MIIVFIWDFIASIVLDQIMERLYNTVVGFFAVNLFNIVPIRLYQFCISLQASLTSDPAGIQVANGIGPTATEALHDISTAMLNSNQIVTLFVVIMMGYAVIKVFFANINETDEITPTQRDGESYRHRRPK